MYGPITLNTPCCDTMPHAAKLELLDNFLLLFTGMPSGRKPFLQAVPCPSTLVLRCDPSQQSLMLSFILFLCTLPLRAQFSVFWSFGVLSVVPSPPIAYLFRLPSAHRTRRSTGLLWATMTRNHRILHGSCASYPLAAQERSSLTLSALWWMGEAG